MNKFLAFVILLQLVGVGYFLLHEPEPSSANTEQIVSEPTNVAPKGDANDRPSHPPLWVDFSDERRKRIIEVTRAGEIHKYKFALREQMKSSDRMMANLAEAHLELMRTRPDGEREFLEYLLDQFVKGATANNVVAIQKLANAYAFGIGVAEDQEKAVELFEKGASLGSVTAKFSLARYILNGRGTKQDFVRAHQLFTELAAFPYDSAEGYLAFIEKEGLTGEKDDSRYKKLLGAAASTEASQNLLTLGHLYGYNELLVSADPLPEAHIATLVEIYEALVAVNNPDGLMDLGFMLERGLGIPANPALAIQYFHRAARLGNAPAQSAVAYHYRTGKYIPVNIAEAYFWERLSENNGMPGAKPIVDQLRAQLSAAEITALETRIGRFKPVPST
ncbi:tetratricopeptide repeat protein [Pseudokordiimonas caeni]|uniref:tetratricopeptide repeat protein n=1 Tax=Pseudokordiimonas caeni TaxID=2997908 RepID=UPI0028117628|nr:tetratricopeptide repeat protein [Pseudokordiimonas caeni]